MRVIFFQHLKNVHYSSDLQNSWWETHCHCVFSSSIAGPMLLWMLYLFFPFTFSFQKYDDVFGHIFFLIYPVWDLLSFLNLWVYVSYQLEVSSYYFSNDFWAPYYFSSPTTILMTYMLYPYYCPTGPWSSVQFLSIYFLFVVQLT